MRVALIGKSLAAFIADKTFALNSKGCLDCDEVEIEL